MEDHFTERDYAATVRAVRHALRLLADLLDGSSVATPEEVAAVREELASWKHGVPASALPTYRPRMAARRLVDAWPEEDPVRRMVVAVYEAARTPLP